MFNLVSPSKMLKNLLILLLVVQAHSAHAVILEYFDWENGMHERLIESTSNQSATPQITSSNACVGASSMEFHLDYRPDFRGYRNEFALGGPNRNFEYGQEYWVSWALFLPSDYLVDAHPEILFQFHGVPDENGLGDRIEDYRNPNVALHTSGDGNWAFTVRGDSNEITVDKQYSRYQSFNLGEYSADRNKWTEFTLRITFDYGPGGRTELWKDGEKVVDDYGENAFNDSTPPYLKIGIYKSSWRQSDWGGLRDVSSRTILYDELKVARNESLLDMAPNCEPRNSPRSPLILN